MLEPISGVVRRIFLRDEAEQIFSLQAKAAVFQRHYPRHAEWLRMAIGEIVLGKRFAFGAYVPEVRGESAELRLAGSIILKSESYSRVMQLKNLYIDENAAYRRRRLGTQLFQAVERFCIKRGSAAIDTEVPVQEKETVAFLNSMGFLVHAHLDSPYRRGDLLYRMYKPLPPMYTRDPFDLSELTSWALDVGLGFTVGGAGSATIDFSRPLAVDGNPERAAEGAIALTGTACIHDDANEIDVDVLRSLFDAQAKRGRSIIVVAGRRFSKNARKFAAQRRLLCLARKDLDRSLARHYPSVPPTFEREDIGGIVVPLKSAYLDALYTQPTQEKTYFKGGPVGKYLRPGDAIFFYVESDTSATGAILARATIRDAIVGDPASVWDQRATRNPVFRSRAEYDTWSSDKADVVAITYSDLEAVEPLPRTDLQAIKSLEHVEDDQVGTFYLSRDQVSALAAKCKRAARVGVPSQSLAQVAPAADEALRRRLTGGELPSFSAPQPKPPEVRPVGAAQVDELLEATEVLIVTAAQVELNTALRALVPRSGAPGVLSGPKGQSAYWFGSLGEYDVTVVRCKPGSKGRDAAILTVHQAILDSDPCAVIGVGIAFGGYTDQLKMNDVLVSEQVIPYEIRRAGDRDQYRGPIPEASPTLLSRFSNVTGWTYLRPDGRACSVKVGPLLSGETLLDNLDEKVRLFSEHSTAIGGEMEAAGIYAAASREGAKKEWIIVKAVCDWADGTKKARGDVYQPVAAEAAMSLVTFVLSIPDVLANLSTARRQG